MIQYIKDKFSYSDIAFELILWISVIFYFVIFSAYTFPSEDAAILFAYAENWANTGVISYYPGGTPTEGATDFLFLCLVTLGIKIGCSAHTSSLVISGIALICSVKILDLLSGNKNIFIRISLILALIISHQIFAGVLGYGTLLFGCFILATTYLYWKNEFNGLVIVALLTVLCRPDGIIIVAPMVLHRWSEDLGIKSSRTKVLCIAGIVPGIIYFIGRWIYFQELFPLPFYVKTQGDRIYGIFQSVSFYTQVHYIRYHIYLFLIGVGLASILNFRRLTMKFYIVGISLIVIPFVFYSTTQQDMNLGYRYQYPLYLGFLVMSALYIRHFRANWLIVFIIINSLLTISVHLDRLRKQPLQIKNNYIQVVEKLQPFHGVIAATDAGYIGWLSHWEVHDLWGLNTPTLSKKLASLEDIRQINPDLVEIAPYPWDSMRNEKSTKTFHNLIQNTFLYLHQSDYQIWRLPYPEPQIYDEVWLSQMDAFFRSMTLNNSRRNTDTVTFGIRRDFEFADELRVIFKAHGGVTHPNLLHP